MNSTLHQQSCQPCKANSPSVTEEESQALLQELAGWHIVQEAGIPRLEKTFPFSNFVDAMAFAQQITDLAEAENHHPLLCIEWGKVTVQWWTHTINNLHKNDFILAARCNCLVL